MAENSAEVQNRTKLLKNPQNRLKSVVKANGLKNYPSISISYNIFSLFTLKVGIVAKDSILLALPKNLLKESIQESRPPMRG
jgi:hypothetical protein